MDNGTRRPARRSTTPFLFDTHACLRLCQQRMRTRRRQGVYTVFFPPSPALFLSSSLPSFSLVSSSRRRSRFVSHRLPLALFTCVSDFFFKRAATTTTTTTTTTMSSRSYSRRVLPDTVARKTIFSGARQPTGTLATRRAVTTTSPSLQII